MSRLITFEGIEGSGKSTQIQRLRDHLGAAGYRVITTREPGGCRIADDIRHILLASTNTALAPTAELLLYAAARAQHVAEVIRPALDRGEIVLCDRYVDATVAYQGWGRMLDLALIEQLNRTAAGTTLPDLTLLLDLPVEEGLHRARQRNHQATIDEGRFEAESIAFHQRVRDGYLDCAARDKRFVLIDADGTPDVVATRIHSAVTDYLRRVS